MNDETVFVLVSSSEQSRSSGVHDWTNCESDVSRCAEVHGSNDLHQPPVECTVSGISAKSHLSTQTHMHLGFVRKVAYVVVYFIKLMKENVMLTANRYVFTFSLLGIRLFVCFNSSNQKEFIFIIYHILPNDISSMDINAHSCLFVLVFVGS